MPDQNTKAQDAAHLHHLAISKWENEGGTVFGGPQEGSNHGAMLSGVPALTDAELVQLRIRVIALENSVISLLAQCSDRQLDLVRQMAAYISPRPGFTCHPLTVRAAAQMVHLVARAGHCQDLQHP
jgi:hypothetical protein